ncbi:hypothetical protein Misp01_34560 [Microtetraspora sp. NBRC 13810]|uniref:hypothetical protein n=1 Tax=Microtetraspora sp. NBRC 13810 TaxID=3030990 RepID=UPI00249F9F92|nr:hypothetical protein [Microtetraspora sp. NBRC 13810]GLW08326.1 hypothetical protein Misp01_34560 [Microtetraspora sp. NBRC 13810]
MTATPAQLAGDWTHAREEDSAGVKVYRPAGHPLPPARWRHRLELRADGTYVDHRLGADDRSPGVRGRWTVEPGRGRLRLQPDDAGAGAVLFEVVAAEPGRLTLRDA